MDFRKHLPTLKKEWQDCTNCDLGKRREDVGGKFVFGEGTSRGGVMFIGEGPGAVEEQEGRPFCGPPGEFLRNAIEAFKIEEYYITNLVSCRSCGPAYDTEGNIRTDPRDGLPIIKDEPPLPSHILACEERLLEEIYLIDPLLIVALGAEAAKALSGKPVAITTESGQEREIQIPGAWAVPILTDKKKVWRRKIRGQYVMPTKRNTVRYLMIPLMRPDYVVRFGSDNRKGSPLPQFTEDMRKVDQVYRRLKQETQE